MYCVQNFNFTKAFGVGIFINSFYQWGKAVVFGFFFFAKTIQVAKWQSQDLEPVQFILTPNSLLAVIPSLGWFRCRGHFILSRGNFGCHTGEGAAYSSKWRPGTLLNALQCLGQPPQQRIISSQMLIVPRLRNVLHCGVLLQVSISENSASQIVYEKGPFLKNF